MNRILCLRRWLYGALLLSLIACGESAASTNVSTQAQGGATALSTIMPTSDGQAVATATIMQTGPGTPCPSDATLPPGSNSVTATIQSATNVPATTTLGAMTDIPLGTMVPNDPCIQLPSDAPTESSPTP